MSTSLSNYTDCAECPVKKNGVFCKLSNPALKSIGEHKVVNLFKKGQSLFAEGGPAFGLYCIASGNVKVTRTCDNGREAIVRIAKTGDILGHRSVFSGSNYGATATAIEDTVVCFIDRNYIMQLVKQQPELGQTLITRLCNDLGDSERKLASYSQKNVHERTCELLILLSESHGISESNAIKLGLKLTREEMASMVGTATETLIRMISDLKNEEVIGQTGKSIYIKDMEKLKALAKVNY